MPFSAVESLAVVSAPDDGMTPGEMARRVRQDIALVLGQHLTAKRSIPA